MALIVDFLFPSFKKWTRMILFFLIITVALKPAFEHFTLIRDIANSVSMMFIGVYPVLTATMIAAGGAFSLLNFQPAMLLFANGAVVLTERLLIPLLTATLIFDVGLDYYPKFHLQNGGTYSDDLIRCSFCCRCCVFDFYYDWAER